MAVRDDGGPAFPEPLGDTSGRLYAPQLGMTLRDYFAAKALPQVLFDVGRNDNPFAVAALAYKVADAMLAERGK